MLKSYEGAHKQSAIIEKEIRRRLKKPAGKLTEADLRKVKDLHFAPSNNIEISDAGLKKIATDSFLQFSDPFWGLLPNPFPSQLTLLTLYECRNITDAGLKELANLKQLKTLVLNGTKVTRSGVAQLQKALPNCRINY